MSADSGVQGKRSRGTLSGCLLTQDVNMFTFCISGRTALTCDPSVSWRPRHSPCLGDEAKRMGSGSEPPNQYQY